MIEAKQKTYKAPCWSYNLTKGSISGLRDLLELSIDKEHQLFEKNVYNIWVAETTFSIQLKKYILKCLKVSTNHSSDAKKVKKKYTHTYNICILTQTQIKGMDHIIGTYLIGNLSINEKSRALKFKIKMFLIVLIAVIYEVSSIQCNEGFQEWSFFHG